MVAAVTERPHAIRHLVSSLFGLHRRAAVPFHGQLYWLIVPLDYDNINSLYAVPSNRVNRRDVRIVNCPHSTLFYLHFNCIHRHRLLPRLTPPLRCCCSPFGDDDDDVRIALREQRRILAIIAIMADTRTPEASHFVAWLAAKYRD